MLPREYGVSVTRPWNSISLIPNSRFPFDLWARRKKDRGSCRVKSTLHSPFRSLYRGKNAGHGARCIARCIDAFNFHECTGRFPLRHATIFMIQWAKRTVDKISFRYTCFETTMPASFSVHDELLLLVCCYCKKKRNLSGNLIRLVSPEKEIKGSFVCMSLIRKMKEEFDYQNPNSLW